MSIYTTINHIQITASTFLSTYAMESLCSFIYSIIKESVIIKKELVGDDVVSFTSLSIQFAPQTFFTKANTAFHVYIFVIRVELTSFRHDIYTRKPLPVFYYVELLRCSISF